MRIYLDSAVIIYLVEQPPAFFPKVIAWLAANPGDYVSNELARLEALVVPTRNGNKALVQDFEDFFRLQVVHVGGLSRPVPDRAIQIRAAHRSIKKPDAIHLASALDLACDVFLTNDNALGQFTHIRVELI